LIEMLRLPERLALLREAVPSDVAFFGLPKQPALKFPERHLGLRTADHALPDSQFDAWADTARAWIDLSALSQLAERTPLQMAVSPKEAQPKTRCRIGVAYDQAFHFYYDYNLAALEAEGAELVRFSPCQDAHLPAVDGLYLGGGYPELHAAELSANVSMRAEIAAFAQRGAPIYAECGGLMYLTEAIRSHDGQRFAMVGLLHAEAHMAERLRTLGYAEITTTRDTVLGPKGLQLRGHQFRYSELVSGDALNHAYRLRVRRTGQAHDEGYMVHNVLASYVHVHWGATPSVPSAFVQRCVAFARI
jgi:cobyrinic acid a,c-diamide synthase